LNIQLGIERLEAQGFAPLKHKRIGLLTNASGVNRHLLPTYTILQHTSAVNLVGLLAPEHGMYNAQPAAEQVQSGTDPLTGLPVYSLYGDNLRPSLEIMRQFDVIVCDIQDIGIRYYTYLWTISHLLEAAAAAQVTIMILDRPNPLGGIAVSGPLLEPDQTSLVGRFPVPVCHGMSLGEILTMINQTWLDHPAELQVILCEGWQRSHTWLDTGLAWVPPSPNMAHLSALWQYAGACLIEGTNLSEGRGTTLPFEVVGAPWLDADQLSAQLNHLGLDGVYFRSHQFRPTASKFAGELCQGVQVHITDDIQFQPLRVWLSLIQQIYTVYPDEFVWLPPVRPNGLVHFDRLIGSKSVREAIIAGHPLDEIMMGWAQSTQDFAQARQLFLFYDV